MKRDFEIVEDIAGLDILFVHVSKAQTFYPPINVYTSLNTMTLGLLALADLVDRKGCKTRVLHTGIEMACDSNFSFEKYLKRKKPKIIGLSLHWHHGLIDTLALAQKAKEALPDSFVVIGGFTATHFARDIMERVPQVDCVMKGDSEGPVIKLLEEILENRKQNLEAVENILWRREGNIIDNGQTYIITQDEIDELEFSRFELMENYEMYPSMPKAFVKTNLPDKLTLKFNELINADRSGFYWGLPVGRGCPFNCIYCGGGANSQAHIRNTRKFVFISHDRVIYNIKRLMQHGFTGAYVSFDPQPRSMKYFIKLFRMMREQHIEFNILYSAWGLVSKEFLDEFARSVGPKSAYLISPETGSEEMRKRARGSALNFSNQEMIDNLKYADSLGIKTRVYFSIGALDIKRENFDKTLDLKSRIEEELPKTEVEGFVIEAEPAAPWHFEPEKYGIKLFRNSFEDFISDHSLATYSSMSNLGYTTGFFGDPDIDPKLFQEKLLDLQCKHFCKRRVKCWIMSNFWKIARALNIVPSPKDRFCEIKLLEQGDYSQKSKESVSCRDMSDKSNCSQGTRAPRDQPGLRMTNTLHQSDRENLRHPASSYKDRG